MNERIKELREQAIEWVPNQVDPDTKIRLLNAEKFVELIVRECAEVAYKRSVHSGPSDIFNHFGIEE